MTQLVWGINNPQGNPARLLFSSAPYVEPIPVDNTPSPALPPIGTGHLVYAIENDTTLSKAIYGVDGLVTISRLTLNYVAPVVTLSSLTIAGVSSVVSGESATYSATAHYSDNTTVINPVGINWGISNTLGSITNGGVMTTTPSDASVTANVTANYTDNGVTVNATKAVTKTATAPVYPYYGVALASSTKDAAFILGLTNRGLVGDLTASFTLTASTNEAMFYAYPVSYGVARFEDQAAIGFFGGWDGATGDPLNGAVGPLTINVTINGTEVPFYLYQTDFTNIGTITWHVSH